MEKQRKNESKSGISADVSIDVSNAHDNWFGGLLPEFVDEVFTDPIPEGYTRLIIDNHLIDYDPSNAEEIIALEGYTKKTIQELTTLSAKQETQSANESQAIMTPEMWDVFYETVIQDTQKIKIFQTKELVTEEFFSASSSFWNTLYQVVIGGTHEESSVRRQDKKIDSGLLHLPSVIVDMQDKRSFFSYVKENKKHESFRLQVLQEINTEIVLRQLEEKKLETSRFRQSLQKQRREPIPSFITTKQLAMQQSILASVFHTVRVPRVFPSLVGVR